jgi:hypothetical protein
MSYKEKILIVAEFGFVKLLGIGFPRRPRFCPAGVPLQCELESELATLLSFFLWENRECSMIETPGRTGGRRLVAG